MNTWKKLLIISGMCSLAGVTPAFASSLAGISVALNNYYAGNAQPEKKLASSYDQLEATAKNNSSVTKAAAETKAAASAASKTKAETKAQTSSGAKAETKAAAPKETKAAASQTKAASSSYDNIAVSKVSGSVNIRTEANTTSSVTGKIYNDCAATILDTVEGEGGKWYKIQSGSVTGYIKSEYFVTGQKAETKAKEVWNCSRYYKPSFKGKSGSDQQNSDSFIRRSPVFRCGSGRRFLKGICRYRPGRLCI